MSITIKIAIPLAISILLSGCGGGGGSVTAPHLESPTDHKVKNQNEAALFLTRASFGATEDSIKDLSDKKTYEYWLDTQFDTSPTFHFPLVKKLATKMCANVDDKGKALTDSWEIKYPRHQIWWETAVNGDDQLRQRVAFALSEILVVSDSDGLGLADLQYAVTSYYDVLVKHAFGNFRDLLTDVTLHPAMGDFLSMSRNRKEDIEEGIRPDENYARELLQLFSIGVHELNIDGTEKLDGKGQPIPTYNQKTIEEFAKVFTGWNYADAEWFEYFGNANHTSPLEAFEEYHDITAKKLLNGKVSPANQTARQDIDFALNNVFSHANIAPFISKQLIQRLVTSNPTPAYVGRVAKIFNNNGKGIKGDLKAVVKAVLLDDEALASKKPADFGKLKEPILRMTHLWRAFDMQASLRTGHYWESDRQCGQGNYKSYNFYNSLSSFSKKLGQGPLQATSVFNFFKPDYSPNGILNDKGLKAPEFQILNENTLVGGTNLIHRQIQRFSDNKRFTPALEEYSRLDFRHISDLAEDTNKLLDYLNIVLLNKQMSASLRTILSDHLNGKELFKEGDEGQFEKAKEAVLLITSSPEYLIQR